jgi:hypothetical protein
VSALLKRILLASLSAALLAGALPAGAGAFTGAFVPAATYTVGYGGALLNPRIVCPPRTQSTPRPGDFSFCRGTVVFTYKGRQVAYAPFSVRTFDSHVVKVPVPRSARRLFPPRRRVILQWVARSHDGQGQWATRQGTATMVNVFKG